MEYKVRISGSGTPEQLKKALMAVARAIGKTTSLDNDSEEWEEPILLTRIEVLTEEKNENFKHE